MLYQVDKYYTFQVQPGQPSDDFYTLEVDGPDGPATVTLNKLEFQKNPKRPQPTRLECRVRGIDNNGLPVLGHAIATYVDMLYSDIYARGESFECIVAGVPVNPAEEPYNVRDHNGIFFRIYETEGLLTKGQHIRCKFKSLSGKRFELQRVDEKSKLPFLQPGELLEAADVSPVTVRIVKKLMETPQFENVRAEISARKSQWPLTAAKSVHANLSEWFVELQSRRHTAVTRTLLADLKSVLLYLLEGSNFLNGAPSEQRRAYQQLLTELVEGIEPYNVALRRLVEGSEDAFVRGLFDKLQKSGYLYHPAKQFGVMMLVFRVYPAKVSSYLNSIFESIFMRDLDNWKREPFRSAFVEQFQIYVRQARREIDALPLAENRDQKQRLETIITALALEMLLAGDEDTDDRTRSLFYRYVSLLRPLAGEALLAKSFLALLGCDLHDRLEYSMLREPMMMMTQASVMPAGDIFCRLESSYHYSNGTVDLSVSEAGITLNRCIDRGLREQGAIERVVPDGLMPWLKPQIFLNGIRNLTGSKLRHLSDHNLWWKSIENALFEDTLRQTEAEEARLPEIGDKKVWIIIDGVTNQYDVNPTFLCHVDHEGILPVKGTIKRSEIVLYNLKQPSPSCYRTPSGQPLAVTATVIGKNDDGTYQFSLKDQVNAYIGDVLNYTDEFLAVITAPCYNGYIAISSDGIGLVLSDDSGEGRRFGPGSIVHFRLKEGMTSGSVNGYITDTPTSEEDHFDKTTAFSKLMNTIGEPAGQEASDESLATDDINEYLTADTVREIIEIMRFRAIAASDLIKAYDYLQFARLMALTISDQALAEKLQTHAALLAMHQFYAANSRIDADELETLRGLSHNDPLLEMIFHRLETVSWLGKHEHNADLFDTVASPGNELEGSLARMVLSYNMMQAQRDDDDETIAAALKERIMRKLNVNYETKAGTYYGTESKYLEFKTSIVYPATTPGQEMRENPAGQQAHILSRIAGMLNASGGTLYIGVNNDGYAVGLREDFRYYERHKARVGNHQFDVKNTDSMCVFLENLVNKTFGETIARKIEIGVDDKADKDVIVISIKESLTPVYIDGHLYVRQSCQSTREYYGRVLDEFVAEREMQRLERQHMQAVASAEALKSVVPAKTPDPVAVEPENEAEIQTDPAEMGKAADDVAVADAEDTHKESGLQTSKWRPNVLHYYEDGYNEPDGYLYFTGETGIVYSSTDIYMEGSDDCRLALVIPHELKDGFLVLGFANERVLKVPLSEIYERGESTTINHSADYRLMFAAVAAKDDLLLAMAADSNNTVWRRAFTVGQLDSGHISNIPRRLTDNPTSYTVGWEIVDASSADNFSSCMDDKMAGRRFGETMRIKADDPRFTEKLGEQVKLCRPSNS